MISPIKKKNGESVLLTVIGRAKMKNLELMTPVRMQVP